MIDYDLLEQLNRDYESSPPPPARAEQIARVRLHFGMIDGRKSLHPGPALSAVG